MQRTECYHHIADREDDVSCLYVVHDDKHKRGIGYYGRKGEETMKSHCILCKKVMKDPHGGSHYLRIVQSICTECKSRLEKEANGTKTLNKKE